MTVQQHLESRYLDLNLHRTWIAEELGCAVFPLWNLSGQIVGYQRYRPNASKEKNNDPREGRYFTRVKEGKVGVWGLESWHLSDTLFITEGVFDACRITARGYSAIGLLSFDVSATTKRWLWTVRKFRRVVAVCDNDPSGLKLRTLAHTSTVVEGYGDLGDASEEYVTHLLKKYS